MTKATYLVVILINSASLYGMDDCYTARAKGYSFVFSKKMLELFKTNHDKENKDPVMGSLNGVDFHLSTLLSYCTVSSVIESEENADLSADVCKQIEDK